MISRRIIRLGLTVLGVIGVPVTSWLSVKCHEKAKDAETTQDKLLCYIPAALSGAVTCGSIIANYRGTNSEIAALTATATYAVANRNKLEEKLAPHVKNSAEAKEIKQDVIKALPATVEKPELTGHGTMQFLEAYSGRRFFSSLQRVMDAESKINNLFNDGDYISYNDFYRYLGIAETTFGEEWGWVPNEDYYKYREPNPIGFSHDIVSDENGCMLCVINILEYPMQKYYEL